MSAHGMTGNREGRIRSLEAIKRLPRKNQDAVLAEAEVLEFGRGQSVRSGVNPGDFVHFLLEGVLDQSWDGRPVRSFDAAREASASPLPAADGTRCAMRARDHAVVLRVPRAVLERQAHLAERISDDHSFEVQDLAVEVSSDWVVRVLQSGLFSTLPPANLQKLLARMEEVPAAAGEVIVRQGDPGDYYYVIVEGVVDVTRSLSADGSPVHLARLGPGEGFGEEALISGSTRNATVTMRGVGRVMRLQKVDFENLIRDAVIREVSAAEGEALVARGAAWLDIRYREQFEAGSLPGAVNLPLAVLRLRFRKLSRERTYIICSDDRAASAVGALLLAERGYRASVLGESVSGLIRGNGGPAVRDTERRDAAGSAIHASGDDHEQTGEQSMTDKAHLSMSHEPGESSSSQAAPGSAPEGRGDANEAPQSPGGENRGKDDPVSVEDFGETMTGKRLAELVAEIRREHNELSDRGARADTPAGRAGTPAQMPGSEDLERRVDELVHVDRNLIESAMASLPAENDAEAGDEAPAGAPAEAGTGEAGTGEAEATNTAARPVFLRDRTPAPVAAVPAAGAEDEIAEAFRNMETLVRQHLDSRIAREQDRFTRRLETRIDNVKRVAADQLRQKLEAAREEYRAEYENRELVLRERYERLLALANRIGAQKAELQKARKELDAKLQAVGQLHRELDQLGRQVSNQIGDLAGLVAEGEENPPPA